MELYFYPPAVLIVGAWIWMGCLVYQYVFTGYHVKMTMIKFTYPKLVGFFYVALIGLWPLQPLLLSLICLAYDKHTARQKPIRAMDESEMRMGMAVEINDSLRRILDRSNSLKKVYTLEVLNQLNSLHAETKKRGHGYDLLCEKSDNAFHVFIKSGTSGHTLYDSCSTNPEDAIASAVTWLQNLS